MKKQIYIAALAIMFSTAHLKAQNKGDIEVGIGIGIQNSLDDDNSNIRSRTKTLSSMGAGISAEYYLSKNWGIKMKLNYAPKGWSTIYPFFPSQTTPDTKVYTRLNYLTIPITANWHFSKNKNWYLNFGPYAGFLLDNKKTTLNSESQIKRYKNTDFGVAYGMGYKFKVKEGVRLFFEFEVQQGLTNIYKDSSESVKNISAGVNFGVLFSL